MTILDQLQSAAVRLVGRKPTVFFSSQKPFEMELSELATDVAAEIMKAHDWQRLLALHDINGDGISTSYPLPADYDRMPLKGEIHSSSWNTWRYTPARDLDQWLDFTSGMGIVSPGAWIILGGALQVWPATSDAIRFYYVSKNVARSASNAPQAAFTSDTDRFVLPERLLTLGLIWRWRSQKRLEYAEDMANYERALAQEVARDKGSRILVSGNGRFPADVTVAYPRGLG